MKIRIYTFLLISAALLGGPSRVMGQGTAFSFQGRLNTNGTPVNGLYDFLLSIYSASSGGLLIAGPYVTTVTVSNGLFTVTPDFGAGVFTGPARWLDISVRSNGNGGFAALGQRQAVLAAPYAMFAGTVSNVVSGAVVKSLNGLKDNVTLAVGANMTLTTNGNSLTFASTGGSGVWSLNGSSAYYNGGNVGVGTSTPASALEVNGLNGNALLYLTAPRPNLIFRDTIGGTLHSEVGGYGGGLRFYAENFYSGADGSAFMAMDTNGNLSIGNITPQARLDITGASNALRMSGSRPNLIFVDTDIGYRSGLEAQGGDITLTTEGYISGSAPNNFAVLRGNGDFCIGTRNADANLNVANVLSYNSGLKLSGSTGSGTGLALENTAGGGHKYAILSGGSLTGVGAGGFGIFDDTAGAYRFSINTAGQVGINTALPQSSLDIVSAQDALRMTGFQPFLTLRDSNAGNARGVIQTVSGALNFFTDSYLTGANANNYMTLANSGNVSVKNITIRGGADVAEPFEFSADHIPAGSVVIIDDEQPGKLKLSARAYDTRVAGIVSGANGVNPGISLYQDGVLEGAQNVALTGRVYVLADATKGAIKPGDLLTTSNLPGHAMKVIDHAKAQGAILGKAMSSLSEGKGMVLVLVTLQ
jgi:hypothetical protein